MLQVILIVSQFNNLFSKPSLLFHLVLNVYQIPCKSFFIPNKLWDEFRYSLHNYFQPCRHRHDLDQKNTPKLAFLQYIDTLISYRIGLRKCNAQYINSNRPTANPTNTFYFNWTFKHFFIWTYIVVYKFEKFSEMLEMPADY